MEHEHLAALRQDAGNARGHNPRNVGMIEAALAEVGAARSIVIDEDYTVLAGNATIEAAAAAGIENVQIIDADGETIIAVRRSGLTPEQKRRLALYDNRAAELADWDADVLAAIQAEDDAALDGLWYDDEIDEIVSAAANGHEPVDDPGAQIDRAEELREQWGTERGQLWQIGRHRLLCGDATSAEDVARLMDGAMPTLMVTDPPYGVDYDPAWRQKAAEEGHLAYAARRIGVVSNDDRLDWSEAWGLFPGDVVYCWHAGRHASEVQTSVEAAGFEIRCQIIWAKSNYPISRGHYHWRHEPCWYAVRKGSTAHWIGDRKQTTLWEINLDKNAEGGHGTQKPVECMARPIRNHEGDVYDPFLGSGTTMVAAEQLGRMCYGMDIEPKYVAVALERMAGMGLEPELLDG